MPAALSINPSERVTYATEFQDEHVLVVQKRAGLVTNPGKGHEDDTLMNGVFAKFGKQLQQLGAARDFGLLHRLDKETSGLVVVALTAPAYDALRAQFESRSIRKFYWAVVSKAPKSPDGVIDKPIAETTPKKIGEKKLAKISGSGKPAVTAYRTLSVGEQGITLLECRPLTGRLHQVRVHLEMIGCAILGDGLYARSDIAAIGPRLALHAHRLAFTHPASGAGVDLRTAFPRDLRSLLEKYKLPRPDLEKTA